MNQFAILCGPPITGKSTIWNVVAKTINSTILNSSNNKDSVRKSINFNLSIIKILIKILRMMETKRYLKNIHYYQII